MDIGGIFCEEAVPKPSLWVGHSYYQKRMILGKGSERPAGKRGRNVYRRNLLPLIYPCFLVHGDTFADFSTDKKNMYRVYRTRPETAHIPAGQRAFKVFV